MTTLTIVFDDSVMIKDGYKRAKFDSSDSNNPLEAKRVALGHQSARAIQWNTNSGDIEYSDGSPNGSIGSSEIDQYLAIFEAQYVAETKTKFLSQDASEIAREKRNELIQETDWWANSDLTMTAEQTAYRQALRDLPDHATDWNPALSWDDDTWTGSLTGVTWPTKP